MSLQKIDVRCPKCNKKNRIKIRQEYSEEDMSILLDKTAFKHTCLSCEETWYLDYSISVTGKDFLVIYKKEDDFLENKEEKIRMRLCHSFEDFKEKLLLFHDGLDDIVIEFIKDFLYRQLEDSLKEEVREIRYDGCNETNLIFYLLGAKKSIGCTKEFYERLNEKRKQKKIKGCVEINASNYHQYFRLR